MGNRKLSAEGVGNDTAELVGARSHQVLELDFIFRVKVPLRQVLSRRVT